MESSVVSKKIARPKTANPPSDSRPWIRKWVRNTWLLFVFIIIVAPLYLYTVSVDLFGLFGGMPNYSAIENPENDFSTDLVSADGVSLGRYIRYHRSQVHYHDLSADLVNTLVLS